MLIVTGVVANAQNDLDDILRPEKALAMQLGLSFVGKWLFVVRTARSISINVEA
ncbi:hypothetical protein [Leptolyngbya sp. FACHB-261]|uniref:hypothetical protein n=1 Tax=Leptolyngbya sp. FACHB-261 TaxID=2692806 RepID=UPI001682D3E3|nr:hypothetical protein [Leptolyngbya sp. FACHB-261]